MSATSSPCPDTGCQAPVFVTAQPNAPKRTRVFVLVCFIVALVLAVLASVVLLWRCHRARRQRQRQSEAETAAIASAGVQAALWADVERGRGVVVTQGKGPSLSQKAVVVLQPDGCQGVACPCEVEPLTKDAATQVVALELSPRGSAAAAAIAGVRLQILRPPLPLRLPLTTLPVIAASAAPALGLRRSSSAMEGPPRLARPPQPARALSAGSSSGLYALQEAGPQQGAAPPPEPQPGAGQQPSEEAGERSPSRRRRREDRRRRSTGCQTK